jgi:hypothetical protein
MLPDVAAGASDRRTRRDAGRAHIRPG